MYGNFLYKGSSSMPWSLACSSLTSSWLFRRKIPRPWFELVGLQIQIWGSEQRERGGRVSHFWYHLHIEAWGWHDVSSGSVGEHGRAYKDKGVFRCWKKKHALLLLTPTWLPSLLSTIRATFSSMRTTSTEAGGDGSPELQRALVSCP